MDQTSLVVINIDESGSMGNWNREYDDMYNAIAGAKQLLAHMKENHTNPPNVEV